MTIPTRRSLSYSALVSVLCVVSIVNIIITQYLLVTSTSSLSEINNNHEYMTSFVGGTHELKREDDTATSAKPKLIVHIGPEKTSTSSIQCELFRNEEFLNKDNYFYIGSFIPHMGRGCGSSRELRAKNITHYFHYHKFMRCLDFNDKTPCKRKAIYKQAIDVLHYHRNQGHNIIYSSEHLSKLLSNAKLWELLKEMFIGFDVKVVFTYRHYFSWLLSNYNEIYKHDFFRGKRQRLKWPTSPHSNTVIDDSVVVPLLSDRISQLMNSTHHDMQSLRKEHENRTRPIYDQWMLHQDWRRHFHLEYFALEQEETKNNNSTSVVANFICQMVPDAMETCMHLTEQQQKKGTILNKSINLESDRMMISVYNRGWLPEGYERNGPLRDIFGTYMEQKKKSQEKTSNVIDQQTSYPLFCPSEHALDALKIRSLALYDDILKSSKSNDEKVLVAQRALLLSKWENYVHSNRFCDTDIETFVRNNENEIRAIISLCSDGKKCKQDKVLSIAAPESKIT